eukprot:NODE_5333_length_315_cov_149.015038_g4722_i0.p1 GENE.NODE_5333_length_315_cov_149.015038_g4722_i0~~NODE_5333_length_315_cov_149.015038_g4722_i0.p1  ORF type:complete len:80 (+),score=24.55 NODE_5333_length_315_cov_149.015038_g4722_i0:32-241(+)
MGGGSGGTGISPDMMSGKKTTHQSKLNIYTVNPAHIAPNPLFHPAPGWSSNNIQPEDPDTFRKFFGEFP